MTDAHELEEAAAREAEEEVGDPVLDRIRDGAGELGEALLGTAIRQAAIVNMSTRLVLTSDRPDPEGALGRALAAPFDAAGKDPRDLPGIVLDTYVMVQAFVLPEVLAYWKPRRRIPDPPATSTTEADDGEA